MLSMQEGCIMLFTYFFFFCWNKKGLLNFVSERIIFLKLVYRISNYTCYRGTQREYNSKRLKNSIVKRILVFKQ